MRKLILILLIVLACTLPQDPPADAGTWNGAAITKFNGSSVTKVCNGLVTVGASCNPANERLGTTNIDGATLNLAKGRVDCWAVTASCTGNMATAYVRHFDTNTSTAKVCIYSNDGDAPDNGDSLLACSNSITSSSQEWASSAMVAGTLGVTATTSYYMCLFVDDSATSTFVVDRSSDTGDKWYDSAQTGWHDSPPANLTNATWSKATGSARYSVYVTIGP